MDSRATTLNPIRITELASVVRRVLSGPLLAPGVIDRIELELPAYDRAVYYAPFQKYALNPGQDLWPEGYNQCQPLAYDDLNAVKRGGMLALLKLSGGGYLAMLPLVTDATMSYLTSEHDRVCVEVAHWGTAAYEGETVLLACAQDENPYVACELAWRQALTVPDIAAGVQLRSSKEFPAPFKTLGWCSWEQYKEDIDEQLLIDTLHALDQSDVPVRWMLVDDGHLHFTQPTEADLKLPSVPGEIAPVQMKKKLISFQPDREKFPLGWSTLKAAQENSRIDWVGVWLNFNGYWGGISPDPGFGDPVNQTLKALTPERMQPAGGSASDRFYDEMIAVQEAAGFDFIKVDHQAGNVSFYRNRVEGAVSYSVSNHRALETACRKRMNSGLINCMAHNNICLFNTRSSSVTRCSEDYLLGDEWRGKMHLYNSFGNMMLFGPTVWGDHDMFHSTDQWGGSVMARSKALSGGPICLSDAASEIDPRVVKPLCWQDGTVLRPLAPAVPLPESLFIDPYKDGEAFRVIAPLRHGVAAVTLYNLSFPEKPVAGCISTGDYRWAGGMLQDGNPDWQASEGVIIFDVQQGTADRVGKDLTLNTFGDRSFLLSPLNHGWALIGSAEKYLCSELVDAAVFSAHELRLELRETSDCLFWLESGCPVSDQGEIEQVAPSLWNIKPASPHVVIRNQR